MKKLSSILWGLAFVIVGLVLGGNALGITNIDLFFDGWWTLFIIVPCLISLITDSNKTGSLIGILIGVILLLCCQDRLDFDIVWKLLFPVILVIIGISFIFKDVIGTKANKEIKKLNEKRKDTDGYFATFGSQFARFNNEEFKGTELTAVFGGVKCDLTKAIINEDVVINCSAIFGGIEIYVPQNVKIKIKSTPIFGGVDDKTKFLPKEDSPVLYINATTIFGGVEIK